MKYSSEDLYLLSVISEQVKEIVSKVKIQGFACFFIIIKCILLYLNLTIVNESKSKDFYDPDGEDTDDEEWRPVDDATREKWLLRARTHRPYSRKPLEKARRQCGRDYSLAYEIYVCRVNLINFLYIHTFFEFIYDFLLYVRKRGRTRTCHHHHHQN